MATYEVRVFSNAPEDRWRTLVGKYGPVYIMGGFQSRDDAAEWVRGGLKETEYGRIFEEKE